MRVYYNFFALSRLCALYILSIFLIATYLALEFCIAYVALITPAAFACVMGLCSSATHHIYVLCRCVMPLICCHVTQEARCSFECARHFESNLARPPLFYMVTSIEHCIALQYTIHLLYSQPTGLS